LSDAAARLSRDAEDFASASYNSYTNSNRSGRNDTEAMMLAQQFSAAARTFYRMTVDRRRNQDLRDAYDVMRNLANSIERSNADRGSWYNVQRSLADVGREINGNTNPGPFPPDTGGGGGGRSGRMTWKGRVDDDVRITIRGGNADVETIGGTPYYDGQPNFTASLPSRRVNVRLVNKRGRGDIYSSSNRRVRMISRSSCGSRIRRAARQIMSLSWLGEVAAFVSGRGFKIRSGFRPRRSRCSCRS
jgi:hypothetical protein